MRLGWAGNKALRTLHERRPLELFRRYNAGVCFMSQRPLNGIRVLSFEHFGSAPYATMFLADMGAEVIKIEYDKGDFARRTGPLTLGEKDRKSTRLNSSH